MTLFISAIEWKSRFPKTEEFHEELLLRHRGIVHRHIESVCPGGRSEGCGRLAHVQPRPCRHALLAPHADQYEERGETEARLVLWVEGRFDRPGRAESQRVRGYAHRCRWGHVSSGGRAYRRAGAGLGKGTVALRVARRFAR